MEVFVVVVCPPSRPPNPHQRRVAVDVRKMWTRQWWGLVGDFWRAKGRACVATVVVDVYVGRGTDIVVMKEVILP